jgi:hypothetical protein
MTAQQATAEVFLDSLQGDDPGKLMKDKRLAEDLRYAAVIEKRKNESTISLDDYLERRSKKK